MTVSEPQFSPTFRIETAAIVTKAEGGVTTYRPGARRYFINAFPVSEAKFVREYQKHFGSALRG